MYRSKKIRCPIPGLAKTPVAVNVESIFLIDTAFDKFNEPFNLLFVKGGIQRKFCKFKICL